MELESVVDVRDDGSEYRESVHNIISYGLGIWLPSVMAWIDATVPLVTNLEFARRAGNQHRWQDGEQ
jgi:hypothetical protein